MDFVPQPPHPQNAPGDFYVQIGCCVTCAAPHDQAPTLMGWTKQGDHCFFQRQPQTPQEVEQAIQAMWCSEVCALRYRGTDPAILARLEKLGMKDLCDSHLPPR